MTTGNSNSRDLYRVTVNDGGKLKVIGLLTFEGAVLFLREMVGQFEMITITREKMETPYYFFGTRGTAKKEAGRNDI